ncbi:MAG: hypothetical protein KC420_12190 [Myxococcales bacterium]|nr:hypothetical protein [Myxococcales bacterium]
MRFVHGPKRGETRKVSAKDIVWPPEVEPGQVGLGLDVEHDPEVLREHEADFTPQGLVVDLLTYLDGLLVEPPRIAVDPCAGPGAWGQVEAELWPDSFRVGVELRRSENGGGHYQRFVNGVGIDDAIAGKGVGDRFHEDMLAADAVITNPAFKPTFERGDGRGKARVPRPCWIETFLEQFRSLRVMALLGRTQFGQRGDGVGILADHPPMLQLRATAAAACRGGSSVDSSDYSLWVWGDPLALRERPSPLGWATINVPATSVCGAIYRWEGGRPGDADLSPALVGRLDEARRRRLAWESQFNGGRR